MRVSGLFYFLGFVTALTLSSTAVAGTPLSTTQVGTLKLGMTWSDFRGSMRMPTAASLRTEIFETKNSLRQPSRGIALASTVSAGAIIYLRPTPSACGRLVGDAVTGVTNCLLTFGKSNASAPYHLVDISVTAGKARGTFEDAVQNFATIFGQPAGNQRMQQPRSAPIAAQSVTWGVQVMNNRIRIYLNQHSPGFRLNLSLRDAYSGAISHG
ncbi:MAG: hypothetical protein ACI9U2_000529, partial [Bradymonadia bacterium]